MQYFKLIYHLPVLLSFRLVSDGLFPRTCALYMERGILPMCGVGLLQVKHDLPFRKQGVHLKLSEVSVFLGCSSPSDGLLFVAKFSLYSSVLFQNTDCTAQLVR